MMYEYSPGLEGVPVTKSKISYVDGQKGILEYRGLPIEVLAEKGSFVEVAYLLLFERLPRREELEKFSHDLITHRRIKYRINDLMKCLPEHGHPMDAVQAAVAALGMFYPDKAVLDPQIQYLSAVRLIAKLPTIVAAYARMRYGDDSVLPRNDLDHASNFLYMLTNQVPDAFKAKLLDTCLILHAEHTVNASTFSGMVTASTLADPYTVVASAIGTLRGPLHGGAAEEAIMMLQEIGSAKNARAYMEKRLVAKQRIMGFGHRVYKVKDPRAIIMQQLVRQLFEKEGKSSLYEVALEVERVGDELLGHKGVHANVDFYSGILYNALGIETDLFTPIFAVARVVGWLAHWLEQIKDNRIFRPEQIYVGEHQKRYLPFDKR
jgi:citrate synthase